MSQDPRDKAPETTRSNPHSTVGSNSARDVEQKDARSDLDSTLVPADSVEAFESMPGAPSLPAASDSTPAKATDLLHLSPGQIVLDFQIQRLIGRGAFGSVYLALQLSLQRLVALKVTQDRGTEGRTLAQLEHSNIVQVFSEQTIAGRPLRLLCMQYIAGPTLRRFMDDLGDGKMQLEWTGRDALACIDKAAGDLARLRPDEFGNRSILATLRRTEAICFWGYQLAEGLSFAHQAGILHHDVKPANILINLSGVPLLADFNLAQELHPDRGAHAAGGTLYYMAPEQLQAFAGDPGDTSKSRPSPNIGATADVYSLGLVLTELLLGRLPLPESETSCDSNDDSGDTKSLQPLLNFRMSPRTLFEQQDSESEVNTTTKLVLQRACVPEPLERTPTAKLLARELRGCLRISELESAGQRGPHLDIARRYPFGSLLLLAAVPHAVGSFVNIAYNAARVSDLGQHAATANVSATAVTETFASLTLWYNLIVWPVCILILTRLILSGRSAIEGAPCRTAEEETRQRRQLLRLPSRMSLVAMLGWLPGLFVFPAGLQAMAGVPLQQGLLHFGVNLLMSGSIAFGYSYMGAVWMIMTVCYLRLWRFPAELSNATVLQETRALLRPLTACRIAAGITPLLSAILIIAISPASLEARQYSIFRALLTVLIAVGILGYQFSARVTSTLTAQVRQGYESTR